jgi:hypothetical protein
MLPLPSAAQTPDAMATGVSPFDGHFENKTLRLDFFHTGGLDIEIFALDQVVSDGPWAGSTTQLFDDTNVGAYFFEVIDPKVDAVLYSRGFASIYGEWATTPEAKEAHRTFHESLRLPWPKHPVRVVLHSRDQNLEFQEIWSVEIDPNSRTVNPADRAPAGKVWAVHESGPPQQKVDLLLLSEGYTTQEMDKFHADAKRLVAALFSWDPFKGRKDDFNVWAIDLPSAESGGNRPRARQFRRTALSTSYNIFDSERYVLTYDNRALRDIASAAPYEFLEILVNDAQYGGGGIFNNQATTSVDTGFAEYVFVHEFGHHFAGLGDEYYTSPVSYATSGTATPREPWSPNVTNLSDPKNFKWADMVTAGTPLPTPWNKEEFDRRSRESQVRRSKLREQDAPEDVMDKFFREIQDWSTELLGSGEYADAIGAFEGAEYEEHGLYRPEADCIMFTRDEVGFCRVCQRAIARIIDLYSR